MNVRRISDLNFSNVLGRSTTPSPSAWEDQVLYFLLVDRFSDGREDGYLDLTGAPIAGTTPPYLPSGQRQGDQHRRRRGRWRRAGANWAGGTLAGVRSKLGDLRRLGVTALWISPVLKQSVTPPDWATNYHGYATQNFLAVEPRFGSDSNLRDLVAAAHNAGLCVILDIVLNHTGDVFAYDLSDPNRYPSRDPHAPSGTVDPRWDGLPYPVAGWRDGAGGLIPFTSAAADASWPNGAVFPAELHLSETFTREGRIDNREYRPEYLNGDFFGLKDVAQGSGDIHHFVPSPAMVALTRAYCWWLVYADLDEFRIDTVKHMERGATRYFASAVHEFAESIGKNRFFLVGEITGTRSDAIDTMELTGLDAALGLADVQQRLEDTVKGHEDPTGYFTLFRNSELIGKGTHTWLRNTVVISYDDHDQVRRGGNKARFCAAPEGSALALAVLAMNATTLGIPCIYCGSEQRLDGSGGGDGADRYIREAMFGGKFGPFRGRERHLFDEGAPLYQQLAAVLALRSREPALRHGRQYLRDVSGDGQHFSPPTGFGQPVRSVVAWSRILADRELLCAINTDPINQRSAWVTVDAGLHQEGDKLPCLYRSDTPPHEPLGIELRNGNSVWLSLR
jgi:glycosidase